MDAPAKLRPTAGQQALAEALARGEQVLGTRIETMSASVYTDTERFTAEQRSLFATLPLVVAPSALLAASERAVAHDGYGVPLIISRDPAGAVHVLANSCRHRGTRLISPEDDEPIRSRRMVCPYHAWTYRADGSLAGIPRAECFPGLDPEANGLRAFAAVERGGLIWFAKDGAPDLADLADVDAVAEDFDAFGFRGLHLYKRRTHHVAANWKMVIDAFLEAYHVQRLHADTIAGFFADGVTVADRIGPHQRALVGRADYLAEVDRGDWAALRRAITYTYHLFPNTIVVVSPDYVNVMTVMPQSVGHSLVEDFMLIPEEPRSEEAEEHWRRSWELLDGQAFAKEDFKAAELCQRGVDSGLVDEVLLGTLEGGISEFHAKIEERL